MHPSTLAAFIAVDTVLCFVPGLAVMAVVSAALTRKAAGFATGAGILTGNGLYFVTSALGVMSVLVASHVAFAVLKWLGAAYLAYVGVRGMVTGGGDSSKVLGTAEHARLGRHWTAGTLTQLANPKALVFFAAIVPQFIDPHVPVLPQMIALGIASLAVEAVVLTIYILAIDVVRKRGVSRMTHAWAERIGGACLVGVAAAVAFERG